MNKINDEVLAAISAALEMLDKRPGYKLVVKAYKRVNQTSPVWNAAGRNEAISSRF